MSTQNGGFQKVLACKPYTGLMLVHQMSSFWYIQCMLRQTVTYKNIGFHDPDCQLSIKVQSISVLIQWSPASDDLIVTCSSAALSSKWVPSTANSACDSLAWDHFVSGFQLSNNYSCFMPCKTHVLPSCWRLGLSFCKEGSHSSPWSNNNGYPKQVSCCQTGFMKKHFRAVVHLRHLLTCLLLWYLETWWLSPPGQFEKVCGILSW